MLARTPGRSVSCPATDEQLRDFEAKVGPSRQTSVGSSRPSVVVPSARSGSTTSTDSSSPIRNSTRSSGHRGWTMGGVFVVGWDGTGNPYGIELETGRMLVEDHNFGGIHEMASSFEDFLVRGLFGPGGGE